MLRPSGQPSVSLSSALPSLRFSTFPKGLDSPFGPTFGCSISRLPRRSIVFPLRICAIARVFAHLPQRSIQLNSRKKSKKREKKGEIA
jgi:hypothetical protein